MTREPAGYGSPGAFRRALTDRLRAIAVESRWALPHLRRERVGATLWEQGRLVPGWLWLSYHRRRLGPEQGTERLQFLETEGRVVLRMLRTPDLHWLGRRRAPALRQHMEATGREVGLHLYVRANDVANGLEAALGPPPSLESPERQESEGERWFLEAGGVR